jgi:thioredoxin-like negative regulator of GroEL
MITELPGKTPAKVIDNDFMRNQMIRESLVRLGVAAEFQTTNDQLWVDLSACYQNLHRSDLAQHTLEKGLKHNPESMELSFALMRLLIESAHEGQALAMMRSREKELIDNLPLFSQYWGLLWKYDQIAELEKVLSHCSEEINEESFYTYYQTKLLLLQQRSEEAVTILVDFFESKTTTKEFTDLFIEACRQLLPYKFPWTFEYQPAFIGRLVRILDSFSQEEESNPDIALLKIKLAMVEKRYDKAMQAVDHARQIAMYHASESFRSSVDYYADISKLMTAEYDVGNNKHIQLTGTQASDVDSVMLKFLHHWHSGMSKEWLIDIQFLVEFSGQDEAPLLWCLQFIREQGEPDQALMVAERWTKACPHALQAALQKIKLLVDAGRNREAGEEIQKILRQEEYIAGDQRLLLVKSVLKMGDYALLEQIAFPVDETGNLSLLEWMDYYRLLMDHGKYRQAVALIGTRQARNETEEILLGNFVCDAYHYSNQNEAALNSLSKLEEMLRNCTDSPIAEKPILEKNEQLSENLLFHATPASVYLRLAVLHRESGNYQNHTSNIEKAYGLAPDHPICRYAWSVNHNNFSHNESMVDEKFGQIDPIEYATRRYGNAGDFFDELLAAELIQHKALEDDLDKTSLSNVKTAKLCYALFSSSDKFLTLCPPKVEDFSARIMREIGLGGTWSPEYGENSILLKLSRGDLWFLSEKGLSHFLPYRWKIIKKYCEENPKSSVAKAAYGDAVIRAYFWQAFLGEMGIDADQSTQIDESFVKAIFDQLLSDELDVQSQYLWEWFQSIQSNQVILLDSSVIDGFTDELFAYYLVAVRKTNTKVPLRQLAERADSSNLFLLLQLAYSLIGFGENRIALEIITAFPAELPDDPILHCVIARVYEANQMLGKAICHLDVALAQYWHVTEWHEWMAGWAHEYEDNGKAALHLEVLYEQTPDNYDVAVLLAHSYLKDKRINKAKKLLDRLIKRNGSGGDGGRDDIEALKVLYFALKKDLATCTRFLTGNPSNSPLLRDAYLAAANLAVDQGKNDLAMRFVQIAYGYQPSHPATLITLAKVLIALHHLDDARKILDQADMSVNPAVCFEKLKLLETISDKDHYSEQLLFAYGLFPHHSGIMDRLARYLANTGNEQKASDLLGTLFAQIKPAVEQLMFAGELHLKLGNLDKAISYMSEVIQIDPENTKAYLTLASAYVHQRQYSSAMEVYERAIAQQPDDHQAYYQAGILLRDLKRFQEAESFLKRAVKLAPNNWDIRNQLGAVMALNFIDHHH